MCLCPVPCVSFDNSQGKKSILYNCLEIPYNVVDKNAKVIYLPCRKCVECIKDYSTTWSYRVMNESSLYKKNCFITLTYSNISDNNLHKEDLQKFMKRLRKHFKYDKIRFFACGEYGSLHGRPHFHIILFNCDFPDKVFFKKDKKGSLLYRSKTLENLWSYGYSSITDLTVEVAKYACKYMQKFIENNFEVKPFLTMSRMPGIGFDYLLNNCDTLLKSDKIYFKGFYRKLPRYYLDKLDSLGFDTSTLRKNRDFKCSLYNEPDYTNIPKNSLNSRFFIDKI